MARGQANLMDVADHVVGTCTGAKPGERALVLADETADAGLVGCLGAALRRRGLWAAMLTVPRIPPAPHGYLTWGEPDTLTGSVLLQHELVIVVMSTLICLSGAVKAARGQGTRLLFIPADYDLASCPMLHEDLDALAGLGRAVVRRLAGARRLEVTSPDGTRLSLGALSALGFDDARLLGPGELDFFPGGMWNGIPDPVTVEGVVRFNASLYPLGRLREAVEVHFERGRIVRVAGGWEARAWERWLHAQGDAGIFDFSHFSGGLSATTRTVGHDWEDLIVRGGLLISGGENVLYGGGNAARAHFDGVVRGATLTVDGEELLSDGVYRLGEEGGM